MRSILKELTGRTGQTGQMESDLRGPQSTNLSDCELPLPRRCEESGIEDFTVSPGGDRLSSEFESDCDTSLSEPRDPFEPEECKE